MMTASQYLEMSIHVTRRDGVYARRLHSLDQIVPCIKVHVTFLFPYWSKHNFHLQSCSQSSELGGYPRGNINVLISTEKFHIYVGKRSGELRLPGWAHGDVARVTGVVARQMAARYVACSFLLCNTSGDINTEGSQRWILQYRLKHNPKLP